MGDYTYIAIGTDGKERKGTIGATDIEKAKSNLKAQGLRPIKVTEANALNKDLNITIGSGVSTRELSIFCRQFASVLTAGVTVVEALMMLGEQTENKTFSKAIRETREAVEKGETLGNAMRRNKKIYPAILINMIDAGEASGNMDTAFNRMAVHFEKATRIKALVKKAMIYPIVLLLVALVAIILLSVVVVPKFTTMFDSMGAELPLITRLVAGFSDFLIQKWYIMVLVVLMVVVGIVGFKRTEQGKVFFGYLATKAPVFGKLNVKTASANMARTLCTLISSGLSISSAIEITSRSMSNILYRRALEKARTEVEQGVPLSEPLKKSGIFPPMVYHMTKIGEETGNTEGMLEKIAEYYEEEVEITTQSLTALMEPLIIVVMGGIVAVLVLAIYMPMIDMYSGMDNL